ncbi:hypothetical protein [Cognatishimia activa]|uniref:Type IV pilus biogenesis n=1 Tax=Cognatishimia activa TaxID=1715691 RepID=A0A0P1IKZ1_9RHOB|nr:hypothetical protein [Cognatishimia activa]CUI29034.1 Type IV pilus biogenesis [Cognatishimia activa]CUK24293.1 Type IV pilus biogenesis [Cognatishimia activa]
MKPDYALSLSLDGIKFLCRVDGGWHQLGDVPLEHADLNGALSELRGLGEDHAGGDALCKIILPNDQIKYLTLDDVTGDQDAAIAEALESATPYALDELAYDFVETNGGVQIAAVARETLGEALDFATEHGFQPVSFTSIPRADQFDAEPFFGTTPNAQTLVDDANDVSPDDTPVFVVSEGPLPETTPEPAPSFASSRLIATPSTNAEESATAAKLGGATRGADVSERPKTNGPDPLDAAAEPDNPLAAQEPRFDPATLIAGLKNRPEPSSEPRARGAARSTEVDNRVAPTGPATVGKTNTHIDGLAKGIKTVQSEPTVRGKPRYLGAVLVIILLAFMAGVAIWASLSSTDGVTGFFSPSKTIDTIPLDSQTTEEFETTALPPVSNDTITDTAEIEAMDDNEGILIDPVLDAAVLTPGGDALYAATGIWDRAPSQPVSPNSETSEAIYLASFEPMQQTHDAIALPTPESFGVDTAIARQLDPVAAGVTFEFDEQGLVIATAAGALSPEGFKVFLGKPAVVPASFPVRTEVQEETEVVETPSEVSRLAAFRPKLRPTDLIEQNERATLGGSTLSEIARIRPKLRPERPEPSVQVASIDPSDIQAATDQAVLASIRPKSRPANFAATVKQQQERQASIAVPRTERVAPSIPTTASVARNATQENAINLRKVNLIGVYGASNDRRALVRLSSGRYKKVEVGDRIDGGKVAAISNSELRYVKGGRTIVLKMPRG